MMSIVDCVAFSTTSQSLVEFMLAYNVHTGKYSVLVVGLLTRGRDLPPKLVFKGRNDTMAWYTLVQTRYLAATPDDPEPSHCGEHGGGST
jgi:hypothetical protein